MTKKSIIAGIVSYNPEIQRLQENIDAIIEQVDKIVIYDNGSKNADKLSRFQKTNVEIIYSKENKGIAYALNFIMVKAKQENYMWVITLDQDSVCPQGYINAAEEIEKYNKIGQIVPTLYESNSKKICYLGNKVNDEKYQKVKKSITSAAITSVEAWEKVGGFDEMLFIDYVDYDFAHRLSVHGYNIIRMNRVYLDHRIGDSQKKNIFFFSIRVSNHSAFRKYYISRNIIIYIKKYGMMINPLAELLRLLKMVVLLLMYEENKKEKMKEVIRGMKDGLKYKK